MSLCEPRAGSSGSKALRDGRRLGGDLRRRYWGAAWYPGVGPEETGNPTFGPCCGWRHKAAVSRLPQSLTNLLKCWPLTGLRPGETQAEVTKGRLGGQVGKPSELELPAPELSRQQSTRWDARSGQGPIPLGPSGLRAVRQVEGTDDGAALPAIVRRIARHGLRIDAGGHLPEPDPLALEGFEVEWQPGQEAPGSSRLAITRDTRRYSPAAITSSGLSSWSEGIGLFIQTAM